MAKAKRGNREGRAVNRKGRVRNPQGMVRIRVPVVGGRDRTNRIRFPEAEVAFSETAYSEYAEWIRFARTEGLSPGHA